MTLRNAWLTFLNVTMIGFLTVSQLPRESRPREVRVTRCDCKPEFNVVAEGRGVCEVVKDDAKWCRVKFNDGTPDPDARKAFHEAMVRERLAMEDPYDAAARVITIVPSEWSAKFIEETFSALVAHALWDADMVLLRILLGSLKKLRVPEEGRTALTVPAAKTLETSLAGTRFIASWGCLELVRGAVAVVVKTPHSTASVGCRKE